MGGRGSSSGMPGGAITPEEIEALQFYSDGNGIGIHSRLKICGRIALLVRIQPEA